jgi:ribosome biogenesis SPOUT family RNA methylase Rps3
LGGGLARRLASQMRTEKLPPGRRKGPKVPRIRLVIENLEPKHSKWLMLEYSHAVALWGGEVTFTNVRSAKLQRALQGLPRVHVSRRSVGDLDVGRALVLDPKAGRPLTAADCRKFDVLVVGGILGGEVMRGRTRKLLTRRTKLPSRHLGPLQLPIDMAVFAARAIAIGGRLDEIEFTKGLTVRYPDGMEVDLPYGYPVVDDKVLVTPGLMDYLAREWGEEEE